MDEDILFYGLHVLSLFLLFLFLPPSGLVERSISTSPLSFYQGILNYVIAAGVVFLVFFVIGGFFLSLASPEKISDDRHDGMAMMSLMTFPFVFASVGLVLTYLAAILLGGTASFESFYHATSTYAPILALLLILTPFILTVLGSYIFRSVSFTTMFLVWFLFFQIYSLVVTKEAISRVMNLPDIPAFLSAGAFLIILLFLLVLGSGVLLGPTLLPSLYKSTAVGTPIPKKK